MNDTVAIQDLILYLKAHEEDIASGINDFDELQGIFHYIFLRGAGGGEGDSMNRQATDKDVILGLEKEVERLREMLAKASDSCLRGYEANVVLAREEINKIKAEAIRELVFYITEDDERGEFCEIRTSGEFLYLYADKIERGE